MFFLRLCLFINETQRKRQRHKQREKQAPCREPSAGLYPGILGSPGSGPEPKADPQPLSHPGAPSNEIFSKSKIFVSVITEINIF